MDLANSIVYTDEWPAYNQLGRHFAGHARVRHSTGEYVVGIAHTNTIEFFGHLKPSIRGTSRKVSHKWLQGYLNEFTFRLQRAALRAGYVQDAAAEAGRVAWTGSNYSAGRSWNYSELSV